MVVKKELRGWITENLNRVRSLWIKRDKAENSRMWLEYYCYNIRSAKKELRSLRDNESN